MDSAYVSLAVTGFGLSAILLLSIFVLRWKWRKSRKEDVEKIAALEDTKLRISNELTILRNQSSRIERELNERIADRDRQLEESAAKLVRFSGINDLEAEEARLKQHLVDVETEIQRRLEVARAKETSETETFTRAYADRLEKGRQIEEQIAAATKDLESINETLDLRSFGFYQNRYDLETPEEYKDKLDGVRFAIKQMIQSKIAAHCDAEYMLNGSASEGRKHIQKMLKLLTRGFNGEADAAIAKVKYNNVHVMEERITKSFQAFNEMGSLQRCYINFDYYKLKIEELHLVHEYREKLQQAKEEQRQIRARMRDEEIARREIAKALENAQKDESKYGEALAQARHEIESAAGGRQEKLLEQIANLERKLNEAMVLKERALSRAQLTRSGHVYVVSNLGSFGDDVYKIGMTRRLDPLDRVLELGDASVPFRFDIHAIIYCDDAPSLETKLHQKFHDRRLNRINYRKEFFRVSLDEIAAAVREFHGEIEFTLLAEAEEYRKTIAAVEAGTPLEPLSLRSPAPLNLVEDEDEMEASV